MGYQGPQGKGGEMQLFASRQIFEITCSSFVLFPFAPCLSHTSSLDKFNKHTGFLHTLKLQFSLPPFQFPRLIRAPPWCLQAAGVDHRPPLVAVDFCSLLWLLLALEARSLFITLPH
jgi:hypothetical protein